MMQIAARRECPTCGGVLAFDPAALVSRSYLTLHNRSVVELWQTCELWHCTRCEWTQVARIIGMLPTIH